MSRFCSPQTPVSVYNSPIDGRGVRANRDFDEGALIEVCPGVRHTQMPQDELADYVFSDGRGGYLMAYGLCSMYNHRDDPNADWSIRISRVTGRHVLVIRALRPIKRGEEVYISYGPGYWDARPGMNKVVS